MGAGVFCTPSTCTSSDHHYTTYLVAKSARSVQENMQKLQRDRSFLQELMSDTMEELAAKGTFTSLTDKVQECHSEKRRMEETILQLVKSHTHFAIIFYGSIYYINIIILAKSHVENVYGNSSMS